MNKYLKFFFLLSVIISCNHNEIKRCKEIERFKLALPDTSEIKQLISVISKVDSFELDYKVVDEWILPTVLSDANMKPPPPMTVSYEDLYSFFGDTCITKKRIQDSIFIKIQVDTLYNRSTSIDIYKRLNITYRKYYIFYKPIFSFDKKKVFVIYWKHCGAMCCTGYQLILEKINSKWVVINRRRHGIC